MERDEGMGEGMWCGGKDIRWGKGKESGVVGRVLDG